ncbi:hypothetical protein D3C74_91550 [compost metagenome]
MEHEGNLLVRVDAVTELGGKEYKLVSYEIWTDRQKYEESIPYEWKEDGEYIYCSNYATTDEEDMVKTFKRRFMSNNIRINKTERVKEDGILISELLNSKIDFKFEEGTMYDAVINGQIWSFRYDGADPDDEQLIWITWATGEEEEHGYDEMIQRMEECKILKAAGIIYPRGDDNEALVNALMELMAKPTYYFANMLVPRGLVLTGHFAPESYYESYYNYKNYKDEYMGFIFDPDKRILTITSPDHEASVPQWVTESLPVEGILQMIEQVGKEKNKKIVLQLKQDH